MPDYFNAIKIEDCEDIIEDEEQFRENGGFKLLSDDVLQKLKTRIRDEKIDSNEA